MKGKTQWTASAAVLVMQTQRLRRVVSQEAGYLARGTPGDPTGTTEVTLEPLYSLALDFTHRFLESPREVGLGGVTVTAMRQVFAAPGLIGRAIPGT